MKGEDVLLMLYDKVKPYDIIGCTGAGAGASLTSDAFKFGDVIQPYMITQITTFSISCGFWTLSIELLATDLETGTLRNNIAPRKLRATGPRDWQLDAGIGSGIVILH